jgi:hypothetical protein
MNCCNDMGNCTQGRDCPIRKQRAKETNDAYINRGRWVGDPLEDVAATFRGLVTWVAVVGITGLAFWAWVKP